MFAVVHKVLSYTKLRLARWGGVRPLTHLPKALVDLSGCPREGIVRVVDHYELIPFPPRPLRVYSGRELRPPGNL